MARFLVTALEHHNKTIAVEAASEDEAAYRVMRGEGTVEADTVTGMVVSDPDTVKYGEPAVPFATTLDVIEIAAVG